MSALERLSALVAARLRTPFAWGVHDCCLWAADAVLAQTGRDPAAAWRGTYSSRRGAAAVLRQAGGLRAVAALAGREVPAAAALPGDVGLLQRPGGRLLGVCAGGSWLVASRGGLVAVPAEAAIAAWRCGDG